MEEFWLKNAPSALVKVTLLPLNNTLDPPLISTVPWFSQSLASTLTVPVPTVVVPVVVNNPAPARVALLVKLNAPFTRTSPVPPRVPLIILSAPTLKIESTVAVVDVMLTVSAEASIVPPLASRVMLPRLMTPPPRLISASNTISRRPVVEVILALILMSLWAVNVKVASAPAVLVMVLLTVISPFCEFGAAVPVITVTLVPAFNAVSIVPVVRIAESLVVVKTGLPVIFVSGSAA